MIVRNLSSISLAVDIINSQTKERTQVNLQPRGKVELPRNFIVENNFVACNKNLIKIIK